LTIRLKSGWVFGYGRFGYVTGFERPDAYFPAPFGTRLHVRRQGHTVDDYSATWRMSEDEIIGAARSFATRIGLHLEDFNAKQSPQVVKKARAVGSYQVPRCHVQWISPPPESGKPVVSQLAIEVNGNDGEMHSLYWCRKDAASHRWPII